MPNNTVRASGEAMPTINRRHMLMGAATIPACGLTAIVSGAALAVAAHDPLLDAINAYRKGIADFNVFAQLDDDEATDAYAEISYMPPMKRLIEWSGPAQTLRSATEAIRLAHEETTMFEASPMVQPVLAAALEYLDEKVQS